MEKKYTKVLHFADVHAEDGPKFPEIEKCLVYLGDYAIQEQPDLIVVPGDIFNSSEVKLDSKAAKLVFAQFERLADVAQVVVSIGTPSHDGNAAEVLQHVSGRFPIHVATTPQQLDLPCALVSAVPAPTKKYMQGEDNDIAAALTQVFMGFGAQAQERGDRPHILLGHWAVEGATIHGQDYIGQEIRIPYDAMMLAGPDCICLGHIHEKQQIRQLAFYPGGIYQKNYGEIGGKGAWMHTFEGRKLVLSEYVQTPSRKLFVDRMDYLEDAVATCDTTGCEGCEVRCEVTCWQDEAGAIDRAALESAYLSSGAKSVEIVLIRVPRQTVRNDLVLKATTLREKLVAMAGLRGETVPASILDKADALEGCSAEQINDMITRKGAINEDKAA